MKVAVLGPLEVRTDDGRICPMRGAKQRLLFSLLLLHAPRSVSSDRLIESMWRGQQPDDPAAALRTQMSRLRRFLGDLEDGDGHLVSDPNGYRLLTAGMEIDQSLFEAGLTAARSRGGPEPELKSLEEALGLWRGEPWEEFADVPDFLGARKGLSELRWGGLERRVACLLELGRVHDALSSAEGMVLADPIREGPRALLMQALHRAGRSHEALSTYQDYRRRLSEELGLDPSPAIRELQASVLRHEPAPFATAPTRSPSSRSAVGDDAPNGGDLRQEIRFCRAPDGVGLAYATVGTGPPLVKAANWLNHLEFDWESPVWRRMYRELAARRKLVRYDERGSGLSDRDPAVMSLDAWVLDLEAVVAESGLERFPLLGISQGCAVCIEYAARHPDQVTGLILHGGYAAGWRADGTYPPAEVARRDASIELVRHGWGEDTPAYRQMFTLTFIPGGTREEIEWFNELERRSVSPEGAARFMEAFAQIDVRSRLAQVQAPTLVLHSRRDQRIRAEQGQELAAGIPGARFVLVESDNHLILEHEKAFGPWMAEIQRFLAEEVQP